jgi:5-methylthioadenosine/S-adenosylhomocysteine deaminase
MQNKIIRVGKAIINSAPFELAKDVEILIENNIIKDISPVGHNKRKKDTLSIDCSNYIVTPGFIQTHIHLCQTLFRGLADDMELLDWLLKVIFPCEAKHTKESMQYSSRLGLSEIIRSGTTTIMDMGTINHEEVIIEEVYKSGIRAFVGKAMMDSNPTYPKLSESTVDSINTSIEYAKYVQEKYSDRLNYAFTPRFILSCTDKLLIDAFQLTKEYPGTLFHTHASENKKEMDAVKKRCGMANVEYFEHLGILDNKSCLAHCIWLNEKEIEIFKFRKSKVLHCPSSNLKLGSGIAKIPEMLKSGITVSLGADGAPCNNNLSMLTEMRLSSLIQKPFSPTNMKAATVFEIATMGGAKTLNKENEIGSIQPGKKADLVFWDLNKPWNPLLHDDLDSIFGSIVYSSKQENIKSVMVDGRFLMWENDLGTVDEEESYNKGSEELRKLLLRNPSEYF